MKMKFNRKLGFALAAILLIAAVATPQLDKIVKVGGAVAVVSAFGKQMNTGIDKLWNRKANPKVKTKVVVILTVGLGTSSAVGAAQVMGPPALVDKVVAVAQPQTTIAGFKIRALIPVSSKNVLSNIRVVDGVGVSGIVDIRL